MVVSYLQLVCEYKHSECLEVAGFRGIYFTLKLLCFLQFVYFPPKLCEFKIYTPDQELVTGVKRPYLDFLREVVVSLLTKYGTAPSQGRRLLQMSRSGQGSIR